MRLTCAGRAGPHLREFRISGAIHIQYGEWLGSVFRGVLLSGANLRNIDFRNADLRDSDLSGADLSGADLTGADLAGADLTKAVLADSNLAGANMVRTIGGPPGMSLAVITACTPGRFSAAEASTETSRPCATLLRRITA